MLIWKYACVYVIFYFNKTKTPRNTEWANPTSVSLLQMTSIALGDRHGGRWSEAIDRNGWCSSNKNLDQRFEIWNPLRFKTILETKTQKNMDTREEFRLQGPWSITFSARSGCVLELLQQFFKTCFVNDVQLSSSLLRVGCSHPPKFLLLNFLRLMVSSVVSAMVSLDATDCNPCLDHLVAARREMFSGSEGWWFDGWDGAFQKWGYPHSWMVFVRANPTKMDDIWGYPHFRTPPYRWRIKTHQNPDILEAWPSINQQFWSPNSGGLTEVNP